MIAFARNTLNNKKLLTFVFIGVLLSFSVFTKAEEVEVIAPQLTLAVPLKGTFSQHKVIKPLKRPFISTGDYIYYPSKGLLWQTKTPVQATKLFAQGGVYSINKQGERVKEAQLDNDFFLALFSADEEKLNAFFVSETLSTATSSQEQCLALTPKSEALAKLFKQITLCTYLTDVGEKLPSSITLLEPSENSTKIELQLSSDDIMPEELVYFD